MPPHVHAFLTGMAPARMTATGMPGIRLFWSTLSTPPAPLVYEPGIVLILCGREERRLDGRDLVYDFYN